jgi:8-oxo-dGTP pyrophosphatase MutT (NUDIX family)
MASETEHCGQKQIRCAEDFCRGLTPTVCAKRKTATDFCPVSNSRLQRRQYKPFSKGHSSGPFGPNEIQTTFSNGRPWAQVCRRIPATSEPSFALGRSGCFAHSTVMGAGSSAKITRELRRSKRRQQVAAVCYRMRKRGIEFLLVQTRGARWIFPKGGVEPGLTLAQSAALEAFEEAGVHGRMEEIPFARYFRRRPDATAIALQSESPLAVAAHLCEVSRLEPPQESDRNPTWFSAESAKRRLLEDRTHEFGAELSRVVDRAVARIQRLRSRHQTSSRDPNGADALRHVSFEAPEGRHLRNPGEATAARNLRQHNRDLMAIDIAVQRHLREPRRPVPRLGAGADFMGETAPNVMAIDGGLSAKLSKPVKMRRDRIKARVNS